MPGRLQSPLQWRHNECDGVSNHQRLDCLLNRLFRPRSKKTSKLRVTSLCARNSPVNAPHKGPETWKMFLFHDVTMPCRPSAISGVLEMQQNKNVYICLVYTFCNFFVIFDIGTICLNSQTHLRYDFYTPAKWGLGTYRIQRVRPSVCSMVFGTLLLWNFNLKFDMHIPHATVLKLGDFRA